MHKATKKVKPQHKPAKRGDHAPVKLSMNKTTMRPTINIRKVVTT